MFYSPKLFKFSKSVKFKLFLPHYKNKLVIEDQRFSNESRERRLRHENDDIGIGIEAWLVPGYTSLGTPERLPALEQLVAVVLSLMFPPVEERTHCKRGGGQIVTGGDSDDDDVLLELWLLDAFLLERPLTLD
uniref:Uncharacterized protein n=1 Tax=Meloidogyne javanica TaxID=6303 RepID=A0A915MYM7_MELJA